MKVTYNGKYDYKRKLIGIGKREGGGDCMNFKPSGLFPDSTGPARALVLAIKGTVSRDFLLLVLFINQFPPSPRVFH